VAWRNPNPTAVFLLTLALVLGALVVPAPVGGVLLLVLALGAAVLLVGTWARHRPPARALRLLALGLLVFLAVTKLT